MDRRVRSGDGVVHVRDALQIMDANSDEHTGRGGKFGGGRGGKTCAMVKPPSIGKVIPVT